ncbi:MAG TPA: glycosyltransferase family 2 protein [Thermodesulfovibrionales bacterium]|nr:glycosyltransferase family 2 protein [Thermodesulfovibrionales bacterium]
MDNPLVSIIVRTKDRPKLLKRALQSIAAQTYRPLEVVLVNDGGCELDSQELKAVLGDVSLNYTRLEKNMGRAHAGNVGIENAEGKYVGFLDDDDELYREHVETLIDRLSMDDYYKVAYSDSYLAFYGPAEGSEERIIRKKECFYSEDFDRNRLLFENYIPLLCLLFTRDVLRSFRFEEDLHTHEDWRLLALISREHDFLHIKEITCQYNIFGDSFVDYLEGRYDIRKSASVVFERNKEYINWGAWMHFKNKLEDKIRDAAAHIEDMNAHIEDLKHEAGRYNFLVEKMDSMMDAHRSAYDILKELCGRSERLAEKIDNMPTIVNLCDNQLILHNKVDQTLTAISLFADKIESVTNKMESTTNKLDAIMLTQAEMMNRLSITERIRGLARKLKGSSSRNT